MSKSSIPFENRNPLYHMARGSAWMIGMRWSVRGIGLISTIILARLLMPEDFGIIAMAMLVVGLVEVLSESGQRHAVIREPNPDREFYDTAWTVLVLQGIVLAAIILAAAPLGAWYFEEPRAENLLYFLALRPLINAFQNIGTVAFLKDFEFQKDFRFGVYQKIIPFILTVALAWYLRSYWALAYGIVAGSLAGVVLSYVMHPYRPRFCLARIRQIYGFSFSLLFQAISHFVSRKTDEFIVGGQYGAQSMGHYNVASDVGTSATDELAVPMSRALFPIYAKLAHDPEKLSNVFSNALAAVAVLAFSSGVGVFAVAEPLVFSILGEKWMPAAPLLAWLALGATTMAMANACFPTLNATGHEGTALRLSWLRTLTLVAVLVPAAHLTSIEMVAASRFAVMTAFLPVFLIYTSRRLGLPLMTSFRAVWRPAIAAALMAVTIKLLPFEDVGSVYLQLAAEVIFGATVFTSALTMLWLISGRPAGFERSAFGFFAGLRQGLVRPVMRPPPAQIRDDHSSPPDRRSRLRAALWTSGTLAGYHRLRNRNVLTVAAFHRVLDPRDPRWAGADPLWTVSQTFFAQCLDFFEENYQVVSLADVVAAREGAGSLPRWPLLITFDDGWADNRDCALPELRRRGLPAALFVVTGAIGQREGFWQERVLAAFKTGRIAPSLAAELWRRLVPDQTAPKRYALPAIRSIIAAIAELPASEREEILQRLPPIGPGDPAEILDDTGLKDLAHARVAIGTHGVSHEPLTAVDDPEAELRHSWQDLQQRLGEAAGAPTLSFPHGQYGRHELELARRLGYRLMFTSNRGLNRIDGNRLPDVLGRIEVTTQLCGGSDGQFRPEKLALWLFRQPHLRLPHLDRPHLDQQ